MPVHVKCPGCGSVLAAPDELAGSVMSCPQCKNQFVVPKPSAPTPVSPPPPPLAKLPAGGNGGMPPAPSPGGRVSLASLSRQSAPTTAGAPPVASAPVASPATTSAATPPASRSNFYPPNQPSAPVTSSPAPAAPLIAPTPVSSPMYPPGVQPAAMPPPISLPIPTRPPATPSRQLQSAKFISGDASATRIDLGADGKLPELKLEAADEQDDPDEKTQASNPWILIGLLGFSVLASVVMLFVDPGTSKGEVHTKAEARQFIQSYYLPANPPYEPYQLRLRDALLAFNRGDRAEEKRLYREVLDMLHSENNNKNRGLTGTFKGDPPPVGNANDQHLESLVSTLLGKD